MLTVDCAPPSDVDAAIASGNSFADAIRAELPALGAGLCAAVAHSARTWWEGEIRRVIEQNPERAMENAGNFGALKSDLHALQAKATDVAEKHYATAFSDEATAARVQEMLDGPRQERDTVFAASTMARMWEEPLRYVLGEIGEPLARAGLTSMSAMSLDPTTAIDHNGRYRFPLEIAPEVVAATAAYEEKLKELSLALTDVDKLKREKLRQRAVAMWEQVQ